jgi:AmiR/NasT family two-component response regulator
MSLSSWDEWPRDLKLPSQHFCLLLVSDAQGVSQQVIDNFVNGALDAGCVYSCAWGPACARVEMSFDGRWVERNIEDINPDTPVLMTTSHERDSLDDALQFLTVVAWPDHAFAATCGTALVAVIGNDEWVAAIRRQFVK